MDPFPVFGPAIHTTDHLGGGKLVAKRTVHQGTPFPFAMPRRKKFPPFRKFSTAPDGVRRIPLRWTKEQYAQAANLLKSHGVKLTFKGNRKNNPQQLSAVRRIWRQKGRYIVSASHPKNDLTYFKQTPAQLRKWKGKVSSAQVFGNGIYFQLPARVDPKTVRIEATESGYKIITKNRTTEVITLDPKLLVKDPVAAIKKALGKRKIKRKLRYSVYGYEGDRPYDLAQFYWYSANRLMPELRDTNRFEGKLNAQQISDAFKIRIVYPTPKHGKKKSTRKRRK